MSIFYVQDFGYIGTFVRVDYSVSTASRAYVGYSRLAVFGLLLFPVGIPVLFYFIVKYREKPMMRNASKLLHEDFVATWAYFDVRRVYIYCALVFCIFDFVRCRLGV